jgi:hypothetical protein
VLDNIKYTPRLIEIMTSVSKDIVKDVIKNHGYKYTIKDLADKMTEKDFIDVFWNVDVDPSEVFSYIEKVAKLLYKKLLAKRNPSNDDIVSVAYYINKGNRTPPMDIINDLKSRYPDFDFTQVGGWGFWKR